jgi:glycosyltransferase involved in cell wall biosynthesis
MMSVSIVMATYNGQNQIHRQLDSLASQRCRPAELVVTDDRSEDRTTSVVAEFARTASFPVRLYCNDDRLGYRGNFMRGARHCQSELVAFCDQDDWWHPNKLEACVAGFNEPTIDLVYHSADVVNVHGQSIGSLDRFAPGNGIIPRVATATPMNNPYGCTMVFRRSLLDFANLWPMSLDHNWAGEPMAHDQWVYFMACLFGSVRYLNERLISYVQHGNNTIGWRGQRTWSRALRSVFENHATQYARYGLAAERRAEILDRIQLECNSSHRARVADAAEYFRALSRLFAERNSLYTASDWRARAKAFQSVLSRGGYSRAWGLNGQSLCKDACLGILIGPMLPHPDVK